MTERLADLLAREAEGLDVPAPPAHAVIADGRRQRRRRAVVVGASGLAAALVVTGGVGLGLALSTDGDGTPDVAGAPAASAPAVFGTGSEVHVGDAVATVPGTVHSMHYTSVGTLVRSNPNDGASDGSGPESLTLVADDGTTTDLGTIPEGVGPATDPERSVYVLAEARRGGFVAVVREALTGDVVTEQPLPDLPPSYWDVPPLALDGDTLFVGYRNETAAIDLTTGVSTLVDGLDGGMPEVRGGNALAQGGESSIDVVDVVDGTTALTIDLTGYAYGELSPDGEFVKITSEGDMAEDGTWVEPETFQVYDVATGEVRDYPLGDWGWTSDGDLFRAAGDTLTTCDPATGDCADTPLSPPLPKNPDLRLGGRTYES